MKCVFTSPSEKAPAKLLANLVIKDCPIPGVELREIGVWDGDKGPWCAFNGRQYEKNGQKKSVKFLGPMGEDWAGLNKFQDAIVSEYRKWLAAQEAEGEGPDGGQDDDNPFA